MIPRGSRKSSAADEGSDWEQEMARWMAPFLAALGHKGRRRWAPVYLYGLLGPGDRKSVQPMAARIAPNDHEQLHHFIATSAWDPTPLETALAHAAERLVGGPDAVLISVQRRAILPRPRLDFLSHQCTSVQSPLEGRHAAAARVRPAVLTGTVCSTRCSWLCHPPWRGHSAIAWTIAASGSQSFHWVLCPTDKQPRPENT